MKQEVYRFKWGFICVQTLSPYRRAFANDVRWMWTLFNDHGRRKRGGRRDGTIGGRRGGGSQGRGQQQWQGGEGEEINVERRGEEEHGETRGWMRRNDRRQGNLSEEEGGWLWQDKKVGEEREQGSRGHPGKGWRWRRRVSWVKRREHGRNVCDV